MSHRNRHISLGVMLFSLMLVIYMSVYSARIQSGDTLRLFNVVSSSVRYDDFRRDATAWFIPPINYPEDTPYPLEPDPFGDPFAQDVLAVYYRIVEAMPHIGLVHGVWTFNIIVTALSVALVYFVAHQLRASTLASLLTAFAFGMLTIALPYTKTLFRDALVMPFLLLTVLSILVNTPRKTLVQRFVLLLLTIISYYLAVQVKSSAIFALPALVFLLLPGRLFRLPYLPAIVFTMGIVLLIAFAYVPDAFHQLGQWLPPSLASSLDFNFAQVALHTYLFSIGGSFWGTSPVILLGIVGVFIFWRRQPSFVWFVTTLIATYAIGHATATGVHWFGGVSWPPRFLLPVIPFATLLIAPVMDALRRPTSWRPYALALCLTIVSYSLWIQYTAIILPWAHYPDLLPPEAYGLIEWTGGLNDVRYLRWWLLPASLGALGYDIAWLRADITHWLIIFGFAFVSGCALLIIARRYHRAYPFMLMTPLVSLALMNLALTQLYDTDPLYLATEPALQEVQAILRDHSTIPAPLFILSRSHSHYFMNSYRQRLPRPIALPPQRGEPRDFPDFIPSNNTLNLLDFTTIRQFEHVSRHFRHLLFLTDLSEFTTGSRRVVERYLVERHYLLERHTTTDPNVRLLRFDTTLAPRPEDFIAYDHPINITFDEHVLLAGATLPRGTHYMSGQNLPISLYWRALAPPDESYTVALFLAHPQGAILPIQGVDSPPQMGFAPTNSWRTGQALWDNRALQLPPDLPPGDYQLWLVLYHPTPDGIRRAIPQSLAFDRPDVIGEEGVVILPLTITIAPH